MGWVEMKLGSPGNIKDMSTGCLDLATKYGVLCLFHVIFVGFDFFIIVIDS